MKLLLDTHIVIWALSESHRLTPETRALLENPSSEIHVSAVSIWEIGLKHEVGRRTSPAFGAQRALELSVQAGYRLIDITPKQVAMATTLPPIHADPFDRLIVAQALESPYRLVTVDTAVARYSDTVILMR